MNCGIYCIKRYLEDHGYPSEETCRLLEAQLEDGQLSVLTMKNALQKAGFALRAYCDRSLSHKPDILLDHRKHHYYLYRGSDKRYVYLSDVNHGDFRVPRFLFSLLGLKYILCIEKIML